MTDKKTRTTQTLDPALPTRKKGERLVRPRDAATVVIHRQAGGVVEVLMGERHRKHKFLPKRYVFPGGQVDRTDWRVRAASEVRPHVTERLVQAASAARARALAVAAVRETFEETGLIIGAPDPAPGARTPKGWEPFFAAGMAPALGALTYVGRAVTPPVRPIRFNARFFAIDVAQVSGDLAGSGELGNLHWVPIGEAKKLDIPAITAKMLDHVEAFVADPKPPATVPSYFFIGRQQYRKQE